MICYQCGKETGLFGKILRYDSCPHCRFNAHCCRNCDFYDRAAYNECREPSAERVTDKEKANFCDFFKAHMRDVNVAGKLDPKQAAEALFKKK